MFPYPERKYFAAETSEAALNKSTAEKRTVLNIAG